ncbi:MAG: YgjV family protein [Oscillospiraceae bacterium]|nr:YgjV family protein [Oscillospiraceae bacterium]
MNGILLGNLCSLCAMISDSVSGTRKKRSEILGVQMLSQVFYGAGSIILRGYSSTAQNVVAILRNLAAMKNVKSRVVEWSLIALGVVLGVAFNNRGLLGWLPIAANLEYSVAVFRFKDNERGLKLAFLVNMLMYSVFSFAILNYVGAAGNIVVAVTTAISLLRRDAR